MSVLFYETPESMHARKKLARAVAAEVKKDVKASVTEVFKESRMEAMASGKLPQPIEGQTDAERLRQIEKSELVEREQQRKQQELGAAATTCLLAQQAVTDFKVFGTPIEETRANMARRHKQEKQMLTRQHREHQKLDNPRLGWDPIYILT